MHTGTQIEENSPVQPSAQQSSHTVPTRHPDPALADDSYFKFLSGNSEEASWYNLISVLIFNSSDLTGRYIGGSSCADLKRKTVLFMAAFRTIFILTFLLVAFEVSPVWLFQADWFKILNYALFSFTNGYTSTLCAIKAP